MSDIAATHFPSAPAAVAACGTGLNTSDWVEVTQADVHAVISAVISAARTVRRAGRCCPPSWDRTWWSRCRLAAGTPNHKPRGGRGPIQSGAVRVPCVARIFMNPRE